jgi:hypothetical protein
MKQLESAISSCAYKSPNVSVPERANAVQNVLDQYQVPDDQLDDLERAELEVCLFKSCFKQCSCMCARIYSITVNMLHL